MYENIVEAHTSRSYGSLTTGFTIDDVRARYSLFPNEALYIIDCKNVQFEPLSSNFQDITGVDLAHKNEITILYEHIAEKNISAAIQWVETVLSCAFEQDEGIVPEVDLFRCLYLTQHNRVLLKCTTPLAYDSRGNMRYSLGKLIDVTDLIPFQYFSYSFLGPNHEKLYDKFEGRKRTRHILSNRELEVLNLIGLGFSSQQIATKLFISRLTVDKHRRNIIAKMETGSAIEAYFKYKNLALI